MFEAGRFLDDKGVLYKESRGGSGQEARIDCPMCSSGKRGKSLSVNLGDGAAICYRCGWSPNSEEFVRNILGCTVFEAIVLVRRYSRREGDGRSTNYSNSKDMGEAVEGILKDGFDVDPYDGWGVSGTQQGFRGVERRRERRMEGPCGEQGKLELPENWFPLADPRVTVVREYALSRGFPMEVYEELGFGGCVFSRYGGCLIMPAYHGEELVFWQARDALGRPDVPKYRTPPGFSPSNALFNLDGASRYEWVVLCEGIFSAMRVGPDAVATFGNKVSDRQVELLKDRGVQKVVLSFDPDTWRLPEEAIRRGFLGMKKPVVSAVEILVAAGFDEVRVVRLEGDDDPDDTGTDRMRELIESSTVVFNMLDFYDKFGMIDI